MIQPDNSLTSSTIDQQIADTETQIFQLTVRLENAKRDVQEWVDANSSLSLSAQKARAETQSMGRGLGGALLGAKYRASCRRTAASANASIAREVAARRAKIKEGKQKSQEIVRQIQAQISLLKDELKTLKSQRKSLSSTKQSTQTIQSSRSLMLLEKLNEAYQMGLLTQEEYEEKRKKIVDQI